MNQWSTAQHGEADFWGDCTQTYIEETKQLFYALRMKLEFSEYPLSPINFYGKSVIDIGSGPTSMLLKSRNFSKATALDPLMDTFPQWVKDRYRSIGIEPVCAKGEDIDTTWKYDEAIIYNVLQHVVDPEIIVHKMKRIAKVVRLFEWIDIPTNDMHPHLLKEADLNKWLGAKGMTETPTEPYLYGTCYYNVVGDR